MARLTKEEAEYLLLDAPVIIGQQYGFTKLEELHNDWIKKMVLGVNDETLQAHRGSYKTTCVSVALAVIEVATPNDKSMFMRKTDDDVKEIVAQTKKILLSDVMQSIVSALYGQPLSLTTDSSNEISTSLAAHDPRGTSQLVAIGMGTSLTGKHFDRIFTDDIVNIKDRLSRAERERTKSYYQELQNIKNRGGRIFNTGTPWHKEDAFSIMPAADVYDYRRTGLISDEEINEIKSRMDSSLFAANYELKHISSDDQIFSSPHINAEPCLAEQGEAHIDASYGGSDSTAFTICNKKDGNYYIYGRLWKKHVDDCLDDVISAMAQFNAGMISCEDNGDKGYLAKAMRERGLRVHKYHESTNKYYKITSYLKAAWPNVYFVAGTDSEYIDQICDFNENADHDDAPDSCASIIRKLWNRKNRDGEELSNLMFM